MNVVFLGPPGAGKGTQAVDLAREFSIPHISTGEILREEIKARTELGKLAQSLINDGHLVPDDVMIGVIRNRLKKEDARNGFILDGFPRTTPQAEKMDEILGELGMKLDAVIYLEAPEEVIVQRLGGRRVCKKCGKNYHIVNIPPQKEGICDQCGVELYQRKDDQPEAIHERLLVYQEKTAGLVNYYRDRGMLTEVDAGVAREETYARLREIFSQLG